MQNTSAARRRLFTWVSLLTLAVVIVGTVIAELPSRSQAGNGDGAATLNELAVQGGGKYVSTLNTSRKFFYPDIDALAGRSSAIIVGTTLKNKSRLTTDKAHIITDYDVRVEQVLKGGVQQGSTVNVIMHGGRVEFPDGTSAEIKPSTQLMGKNRTYILFLTESGEGRGAFELSRIPQGYFALSPDGGRIEYDAVRQNDPLIQKYKDQSAQTLLANIRAAARK